MRSIRALTTAAVLAGFLATAGVGGQSAGTPPILLIVNGASSANPFGSYLAEILRTEGIASFATVSLASLDATTLSNARLAVLAEAVGRPSLRQPPGVLTKVAGAPVKALARSQRVSAKRFQQESGWRPQVPSRRTGWPATVAGR